MGEVNNMARNYMTYDVYTYFGEEVGCNVTYINVNLVFPHTHPHQTFSPANVIPPARMEPPALTTALVGTRAHVLLATWVPTVRQTSMTVAPTPATTAGHAL